jgi:hypothetical protein
MLLRRVDSDEAYASAVTELEGVAVDYAGDREILTEGR